jgi:hypothetical protein
LDPAFETEAEGIDRAEIVEKAFVPRKENEGGGGNGNNPGGNDPGDGYLG